MSTTHALPDRNGGTFAEYYNYLLTGVIEDARGRRIDAELLATRLVPIRHKLSLDLALLQLGAYNSMVPMFILLGNETNNPEILKLVKSLIPMTIKTKEIMAAKDTDLDFKEVLKHGQVMSDTIEAIRNMIP